MHMTPRLFAALLPASGMLLCDATGVFGTETATSSLTSDTVTTTTGTTTTATTATHTGTTTTGTTTTATTTTATTTTATITTGTTTAATATTATATTASETTTTASTSTFTLVECSGDAETWESANGFGNCSSFAPLAGNNFVYCAFDYDRRTFVRAQQACPECGRCFVPTTTTSAHSTTATSTGTSTTSLHSTTDTSTTPHTTTGTTGTTVTQGPCARAWYALLFQLIRGLACTPDRSGTCPTECRSVLENVVVACDGANETWDGVDYNFQSVGALVSRTLTNLIQGPCQEEVVEALLSNNGYTPTCSDGLAVLATQIDFCQADDSETACPEVCQRIMDVVFDRCAASDKIHFGPDAVTAEELVERHRSVFSWSPQCTALLGSKTFGGGSSSTQTVTVSLATATTSSITTFTLVACLGGAETWRSGFGNCSTYAQTWGGNFFYCGVDSDHRTGVLAQQVCPECGRCFLPTTTTSAHSTTATSTGTSTTSPHSTTGTSTGTGTSSTTPHTTTGTTGTTVTQGPCARAWYAQLWALTRGFACTPDRSGTCPMWCREVLESAIVACDGSTETWDGMSIYINSVGGFVSRTINSAITQGACREEVAEALLSNAGYTPTCQDGLEILSTQIDFCQADDNQTACPEICERIMDVAFDRCTANDTISSADRTVTAEELVKRHQSLYSWSPRCNALLGSKTFLGGSRSTTETSTTLHTTTVTTGTTATQGPCARAWHAHLHALTRNLACMPDRSGACPMECREVLESAIVACDGTDETVDGIYLQPVGAFISRTVTSDLTQGACQEEVAEALLSNAGYTPTCLDGLEMVSTQIEVCQGEDNRTACPEVCERIMDVAFDRCTASDTVWVSYYLMTAVELQFRWNWWSPQCTALLKSKTFLGGSTDTSTTPHTTTGTAGTTAMQGPCARAWYAHLEALTRNLACTPDRGGACPTGCREVLERTIVACDGTSETLDEISFYLQPVGGFISRTLNSDLTQGTCREEVAEALLRNAWYTPTCLDGLEMLSTQIDFCQADDNQTACPELCERVMDVVFDRCTAIDTMSLGPRTVTAEELVEHHQSFCSWSPQCTALLRSKTFRGGSASTTAEELVPVSTSSSSMHSSRSSSMHSSPSETTMELIAAGTASGMSVSAREEDGSSSSYRCAASLLVLCWPASLLALM